MEGVASPDAEVSVLLTDDPEIHALNRQWRGKDKPTDVLSWPQEGEWGVGSGEWWERGQGAGGEGKFRKPTPHSLCPTPLTLLGDVAISLDTAARQASARGWSLEDEVALLLVHGILHLLGHEDDTEAGSEAMKAIEREILGKPLDPL